MLEGTLDQCSALRRLAISLRDGKPIDASDLVDTCFEGQPVENINRHELAAFLYRKALSLNPNDVSALCNLAGCFDEGVKVLKQDLIGTCLAELDPESISINEVQAELYRKMLLIDQRDVDALYNLSLCIALGAKIVKQDTVGTIFENDKRLDEINRDKLQFEICRKIIRIDANCVDAYKELAKGIFVGASFSEQDFQGTCLEGTVISKTNRLTLRMDLVAEFYRKIMKLDPTEKWCVNNILACIIRGASAKPSDLVGTCLEGQLPENIDETILLAALCRKSIKLGNQEAMVTLSLCFERGVPIESSDLIGSVFAGQDPSSVDKEALIDEFRGRYVHTSKKTYLPTHQQAEQKGEKTEPTADLIQHPDEFLCPITSQLMRDPVFTQDEHVYEREAIKEWWRTSPKPTSPSTGLVLADLTLVSHTNLRLRIQAYLTALSKKKSNESKMAPSH